MLRSSDSLRLRHSAVFVQKRNMLYASKDRIKKVFSKSLRLVLIKAKSINEILFCLVKDDDFHRQAFRILSCTRSKSENRALPSMTHLSLTNKISPCQRGEGISPGFWQRLSHSSSITDSLSIVDILSIGNSISIYTSPHM